MIYCALIFVTILLFILMGACFIILYYDFKLENENNELKEKLETVQNEIHTILNDYGGIDQTGRKQALVSSPEWK